MNSKDIKKNNRFSIRKLTIGAASVLIGVSFMGIAGSQTQVHAADAGQDGNSITENSSSSSDQTQEVKNDVDVKVTVNNNTKTVNVDYGKKHVESNAPEVKTDPKVTVKDDEQKKDASDEVKDNISYKFKDTTDKTDAASEEKTKNHEDVIQVDGKNQTNYYKFVQDTTKNANNDRWAYLDSKTGDLKFVEVTQDKDGKWVLSKNNNELVNTKAPTGPATYNIGLVVTPNNDNTNAKGVTATVIVDEPYSGYYYEAPQQQTHTVTQTIIINNPDGTSATNARQIVLTLQNGQWVSPDGTVFNEYPIPQIPGYDSYYKIGENGQLIKSTTVPAYSAVNADGTPAADQVVYISYQKTQANDDNNGNDDNGKDVDKTTEKTTKRADHRTQMPTTTRVATYHAKRVAQEQAALPQAGESTSQAGVIGMAIAAAGSILGLAGFKKRKN